MKNALFAGASALLLSSVPALATDITFYYPVQVGGPLTQVMDGYVADFEKAHPDIHVDAVYAGNYTDTTTKAMTAAKNGTPPTVAVLLATDIFTLMDNEVVEPMDDFIKTDDDKTWVEGFMPAFLASAKVDGHLWAVPFQRSTAVEFYNKDAFRAAGLDPEQPPKTWDELVEMGQKLTLKDASGTVTQYAIGIPGNSGSAQWLFGALAAQNGARLMSDDGKTTYFNDPKVVEALQFWVDLGTKYGIHPDGIQQWGTTPQDFLEGRLAMAWTTTGNLTNIRKNASFDFGIAPYPGHPDPASVLGGGNLYIFKDASDEQKAAAFEFVKFMTSADLLADWSIQTGYVAPREDAWQTETLKNYVSEVPAADVARQQIAVSVPELSTYDSARVGQALNDGLQAALTGQATPQDAMDRAQEQAERILRPYQN
ncbi:ABC transporter substrate-binding protein [Martelella alba]|uniref:ABC transporter substrate-binding protein n=2 Tax=Martelella alba TaxID=2590451 RepID=A0A506U3G3_9HYPH|nr:ABC transporter substrate-binding protein [Martelella alba]